MNDKPMKHEDYLAMAAENQKLKAKVAKMEDRPGKRARIVMMAKKVVELVVLVCVIGCALFLCFLAGYKGAKNDTVSKPEHHKRTTACYFIRHRLYMSDEQRAQPWHPWHIFRSDREDGSNWLVPADAIKEDPIEFASKNEAWEFMKKWNLTPCK